MIVTCERCHARYKLDDAKIKGRGAKITCPKCSHIFVVYTQGSSAGPDSGEPGPTPSAPPAESRPTTPSPESRRQADNLDFRKVGIASWKVKVKIGLVYDFSDIRTLRKYIQDKRVTEDDVISHDGTVWTRLGDIPDLDIFFLQVYREYESKGQDRENAPVRAEEEFEDGPTMIVGMGSLGANLSTGVFQRPDTEPAPPGSSTVDLLAAPRTSGGEGGPRQFVDPFDALKSRQKQRSPPRHAPTEPSPKTAARPARPAKNGKDQPNDKKTPPSRTMIYAGVGGVLLLAIAAGWFMSRKKTPVVAPVTEPSTTIQVPASDNDDLRRAIRDKLKADFQVTDPADILPPLEDDTEILTAKIPEGAQVVVGPVQPPATGNNTDVSQTRSTARDYIDAGDAAAMAGNWSAAADAYGKAVAMSGRNTTYKYKYGQALYNGGRLTEAQKALTEAANGGVTNAHKYLGNILRDQGDVSGAVYHYNQYLKANPSDRAAIEAQIKQLTGG